MIRCNRCNGPVVPVPEEERSSGYLYTCPRCFENMYGIEVHEDGKDSLSEEERDEVYADLINLAQEDCYSTAETCEMLESFGFDENYIRNTREWDDLCAYYEDYDTVKTREVHIEYKIRLTPEDITDIVITMLNGNMKYYACLDNTTSEWDGFEDGRDFVDDYAARILLRGGELLFNDQEDDDAEIRLNLDRLLTDGIKKFVEGGYDKYGVFNAEGNDLINFDGEASDTVFQLAAFGEVIYG